MRTNIAFGEWTPDHAPHDTNGLTAASGVYAIANGYAPVKDFYKIADALTGTFKGAASYVSSEGDPRVIAGDGTDLYSLSGGVWTSVIDTLTINNRWRFTQFGDDVVCATGGAPVAFDLVAGTAAALAGTPPTADLCATVRDFVVLGRADGADNVVQWCAIGDATSWTAGVNQAGAQPLYDGGRVMGLSGGEYGLIIQRQKVTRMSYTGDAADPWQFDAVSSNYGCKAEESVIQAGRLTFFYSDRGFVVCDGTDVKPIGVEKIDRTFKDAYSDTDLANMWAAVDPIQTLAVWAMPNKLWMYNWVLDRWTVAEVSCQSVFSSFQEAVSIDDLDALYGNLEDIPYPLDDPRFAGGAPRLTVINSAGSFGTLAGDNLKAIIGLPFVEFAANRQTRLQRVRPLTDALEMTLRTDARKRLGDGASTTSFSQLHANGDMPSRDAGRSLQLTFEVPAGADWSFLQGAEIEHAIGGRG